MTHLTKFAPYTRGALALILIAAPLGAQQTVRVLQSSRAGEANAQLAFGYACEDKFALRNDGAVPVTVEYAVAGTRERGLVGVQAGETVQLESASPNDVQLFLDGRLVVSEPKGNRACGDEWTAGGVMGQRFGARAVGYALPNRVVYMRPWMGGYSRGPVIRIGWGGYSIAVNGRGEFRDGRPPFRRDDHNRYEESRGRRDGDGDDGYDDSRGQRNRNGDDRRGDSRGQRNHDGRDRGRGHGERP